MNILNKINAAATVKANTDRGQVKTLIIALLSYCKHTKQALTAKQVADIVREYIPTAKTSANSVADYRHNLNMGLFDYMSESMAIETLKRFEDGLTRNAEPAEPAKPVAPWSAADLKYRAKPKRNRK